MGKKVLIFGDPLTTPTLEGVGDNRFGVCLSEVPSTSVTVSFVARNAYFTAPGNLTFTTGNWDTPQEIIIAAVSNAVTDICRYDYLDVSCSGGGYDSVMESLSVSVFDSNSHHTYNGVWGWFGASFTNNKNWIAVQAQMITDMFDGAGIPVGYTLVGSPVVTNSPTVTPLHAGSTSDFSSALWSTCTQWKFRNTDADGYQYDCIFQLIRAASPVEKLWVDLLGSGEGGHTQSICKKMLTKGYDILCASYCPYNSMNSTNNPNISPQTGNAAVSQLKTGGVERLGFNSYKLVVNQLFNALTKSLEAHAYTEVNVSGISASGFPAMIYSALDSRVNNCFAWRCSLIKEITSGLTGAGGTYVVSGFRYGYSTDVSSLQIWSMFKRSTWVDWIGIILNRGGKFATYGNTNDGGGSSWVMACMCMEHVKKMAGVTATRCTGIYDNAAGRSAHQWNDIDFDGGVNGFVGIYTFLGI